MLNIYTCKVRIGLCMCWAFDFTIDVWLRREPRQCEMLGLNVPSPFITLIYRGVALFPNRYSSVMRLVWKTVDSAPRNWRSIAKALILVEHLTKHGAEKVVGDVQQHIHDINGLTEFRYYEGHLDRGSGGAACFGISTICSRRCKNRPLLPILFYCALF